MAASPSKNSILTFIEGAITPELVRENAAQLSSNKQIGAHSIFLGQVRDDTINGKTVYAIEYTAYEKMVEKEFERLSDNLLNEFDLTEFRVFHSLGLVKAGEISLFVLTAAQHRRAAIDACNTAVDLIKKKLPIWGKELFEDGEHVWKKNLP